MSMCYYTSAAGLSEPEVWPALLFTGVSWEGWIGGLRISVLLSVSDILTNIRGFDKESGVIPNKPA